MLDLWYKDAIIYCLNVATYRDSNGDGIGDFRGLTERLDYINGLGINCIWLLPFYPSPYRDGGYDVMDYYNVDPRLGTLGDFVEFTRQARQRGIHILIDLVVNHTSIQHPWFQSACKDKHSPYRNYYIWSEEKPDTDEEVVFPDVEESAWTYHEEAGAYYLHRFYKEQPDLNIANPEVQEEIQRIMGFWLELGVSGFRVDAAPYLVEMKGVRDPSDISDPYSYFKDMHNFLSWRRAESIFLAEANVPMDLVPKYFGEGDKMQMLFNFFVNQHLFLALAREEAAPLVQALQAQPPIPGICQWANFIRNHDELTLDKLSKAEQEEIIARFAPDRDMMWIYRRGIRRRFPPMVDGDQRRIRLAYSLMLTLPGTPVLRYGEEIGMGDNLSLKERDSVRTPMQWSNQPNGGFSTAPPDKLIRPVISEGEYSYEKINVVTQRRDPNSLLNWMERAIRTRRECPEFGWGTWQLLETGHPSVFAHRCQWKDGIVIAVHNLSKEPCTIALNLPDDEVKHLTELLGDQPYKPVEGVAHQIPLEGYGYRWFRVGSRYL